MYMTWRYIWYRGVIHRSRGIGSGGYSVCFFFFEVLRGDGCFTLYCRAEGIALGHAIGYRIEQFELRYLSY